MLCDLQWIPWAGAGQSMVVWGAVMERALIWDEAEMLMGWEPEGGWDFAVTWGQTGIAARIPETVYS